MPSRDFFQRFLFESLGIRGERVRLEESFSRTQGSSNYPPMIASLLGEALSASVLLSGTIKFQGALILQIQSQGPLRTLVAQASDQRTIRGLAHWDSDPADHRLTQLCPDGRLVLTVQTQGQEPHQGIVAVEEETLSAAIEDYFSRSEQLPTRLWLFATPKQAGGLFLQQLPGSTPDADGWNRVIRLTETLTSEELMQLPTEELLYRLYHEERVRLFEAEPVRFFCPCGHDRIRTLLRVLGRSEVESILEETGEVAIQCEFCNRRFRFDAVDLGALFAEQPAFPSAGHHRH